MFDKRSLNWTKAKKSDKVTCTTSDKKSWRFVINQKTETLSYTDNFFIEFYWFLQFAKIIYACPGEWNLVI